MTNERLDTIFYKLRDEINAGLIEMEYMETDPNELKLLINEIDQEVVMLASQILNEE